MTDEELRQWVSSRLGGYGDGDRYTVSVCSYCSHRTLWAGHMQGPSSSVCDGCQKQAPFSIHHVTMKRPVNTPWSFDPSRQDVPPSRRSATVYDADDSVVCRTSGEHADRTASLIVSSVNAQKGEPAVGKMVEKRGDTWMMVGKPCQSCAREIAELAIAPLGLDPGDFRLRDTIISAIADRVGEMMDAARNA